MPDFKVRRKILATGGIDITGTASFSGGIAAGSAGASFNDLIYGSACINQPSAASQAVVVGASLAVTGVSNGDPVWVNVTGSLTPKMVLIGACGVAGGISASWLNSSSADISASADVHVNYLLLS